MPCDSYPYCGKDTPLRAKIQELFETRLYSDIRIITSDGTEHAMHRAIVCSQSPVLANACNPKHGFKEAHTGVINLEHEDHEAVKAMLRFMYTGEGDTQPFDNPRSMYFDARLYAAADVYQAHHLKGIVVGEFSTDCHETSDEFDADLVEALRFIYESLTDNAKDIREKALDVAVKHIGNLKKNPGFLSALDEIKPLAGEMVNALASEIQRLELQKPKPKGWGSFSS